MPSQPAPQSQPVFQALDNNDQEVAELNHLIIILEKRLNCILVPAYTELETENGISPPAPELCEIQDRLRSSRRMIGLSIDKVQKILERLAI